MREQHPKPILRIVDEAGVSVEHAMLSRALLPMVEQHLVSMEGLLLPLVLRISERGGGWLYAYATASQALRVRIDALIIRELSHGSETSRIRRVLEDRVKDLTTNFRSRQRAGASFFRQATRPLEGYHRR